MKRLFFITAFITAIFSAYAQKSGNILYKAVEINNIYYNIFSDGTAEVTTSDGRMGTHNSYLQKEVFIPKDITYNGETYIVTKIGKDAFSYCENLSKVFIPSTVTHIGYAAFAGTKLYDITLPNSLKAIDGYAFLECSNLRNISLPENVKEVGIWAFGETGITEPVYNSKIFAYLPPFYHEYKVPDGIEIIAKGAFGYCSNLRKLVLPESLIFIGHQAFAKCSEIPGCQNLLEINIPDGVKTIESYAFYKCGNLKKVNIGNNVKLIDEYCFMDCYNLESVTLGENLKYIGNGAFAGCENLENVILPKGLKEIGRGAFARCKKLQIMLPLGISKIGERAFYGILYLFDSGNFNISGFPWGANTACQNVEDK